MEEYLIQIASGILIGGITAWIAVRLSLRQFFSQRWWKKSEAYAEIIEVLYNILNNLQRISEAVEKGQKQEDSVHDQLALLSKQGYEQLGKVSTIGVFITSDDAVSILNSLLSKFDEEFPVEHWLEWANRKIELVYDAISAVRVIAKRDLKVN